MKAAFALALEETRNVQYRYRDIKVSDRCDLNIGNQILITNKVEKGRFSDPRKMLREFSYMLCRMTHLHKL